METKTLYLILLVLTLTMICYCIYYAVTEYPFDKVTELFFLIGWSLLVIFLFGLIGIWDYIMKAEPD